jgi:hypothetical protein
MRVWPPGRYGVFVNGAVTDTLLIVDEVPTGLAGLAKCLRLNGRVVRTSGFRVKV